jgi:hypothetical protein
MKIIFQVPGTIAKNVMATAVCRAIKTQYPDDELIVITEHPAVYLCNPDVDKVLDQTGLYYFYKENVEGRKIKALLHDPFLASDFITGKSHLIKAWCDMFGIRYNGELPRVHINSREMDFYSFHYRSQKPLMILQTCGEVHNEMNKYSWATDIPVTTAVEIVNAFQADYHIVQISPQDEVNIPGTTPVKADFRAQAALIALSKKRLLIDSFGQHVAAAMGRPSVVAWVGTSPAELGYDMHTNIMANTPATKPELRNSVFSRYNTTGMLTEFPYNSVADIFDTGRIIEALRNQRDTISENSQLEIVIQSTQNN